MTVIERALERPLERSLPRSSVERSAASPAYTGPLDFLPGIWVAAYSAARALFGSMAGENGFTLRRASDDAELAFAYDATTGLSDPAAIETWASGDSFFKTINDHTGNAVNLTQALSAFQPKWDGDDIGGKPSIVGVSATEYPDVVDVPAGAQTWMFVASTAGTSGFWFNVVGPESNPYAIEIYQNFNVEGDIAFTTRNVDVDTQTWITPGAVVTTGFHIIEVVMDALGNVIILVDGVDTEAEPFDEIRVPIEAQANAVMRLFSEPETTGDWMWANAELSAGNRLTLRQDLAAFYSITLP